ncbi:MAG: DUF1987 domain-containing protein [Vicingaceae bacterium]
MERFILEGSLTTPSVIMDPETGLIELKGKSIPENSFEFYEPLYEWIRQYSEQPKDKTKVSLAMEYFNTSSSKEFMKFFKELEQLHLKGLTAVSVDWYHEEDDEEMMEMGESLKKEISVPIEVKSVEEIS